MVSSRFATVTLCSRPERRVAALPLLGLALAIAAPPSTAGQEILAPPSFHETLPPPAGEGYKDPVFGTFIQRVTDAASLPDTLDSGSLVFAMHEYASVSPWNRSSSRLLLLHESVFALYDRAARLVEVLPREVHARSEPRWSVEDPDVFYYLHENELRAFDVSTRSSRVLRRFDEYSEITGRGESDLSFDGDHLVLVGDDREIFLYQVSRDHKGPVLDTLGLGWFDQVMVTPENRVLVGWLAVGSGRAMGLELFDREMKFVRQVSPATGHMDVGRDLDGREIVVRSNAADPDAICPNGIVKVRLADGAQTCLISLDWSLAAHVSIPHQGPWIFVSTHAAGDPTPEGGWAAHTSEILQVRLDGSRVLRLAHHRSRAFNDYNYMPRVAASRDGTKLTYSSNFGLQQILGYPSDYSDVYLLSPGEVRRPHRPTG